MSTNSQQLSGIIHRCSGVDGASDIIAKKKNGSLTRARAWHIGAHVPALYRVICMFVIAATEALPHLVRAINVYSKQNTTPTPTSMPRCARNADTMTGWK